MSLIQSLNATLNNPNRPLASVAALSFRNGKITDEAYLGHRSIDEGSMNETEKSLPCTLKTKFRVASISKLVATLAVMQLVEQKKLALSSDVSELLDLSFVTPIIPIFRLRWPCC